ncbi:MAG: DUF4178 domain-containing protein [Desulfobacterium sp.]|nr:DUF4178 domain-containing protein [Desulfobacterium sp.]
MGWKDFFNKKNNPEKDSLTDLILAGLKTGYYVDWDMKTWEVVSSSWYNWGDNDITYEWQLKSVDDTVYLEYQSDDEEYWSICRKIDFGKLDPGIKKHILDHGDPPEEIRYNNETYYLEESGGGHYFKDADSSGQELISWNYEDEEGNNFLTIEQWGENRFEASFGFPVEEYQFTDILPGGEKNESSL